MHRDPFRPRLLTAAVAAATLAASAPFLGPALAHAAPRSPQPVVHQQPPGKIPTLPRAGTTRGLRVQAAGAT